VSYYLIRLGEGSKYIEEARKEGFIAIGWNQVPDLTSKVRSKKDEVRNQEHILESIKKELKAEGASVASVAGQAGQIYRFGFEMQEGDRVLAPLGEGRYLVGEVGAYFYEDMPKGPAPTSTGASVRWLDKVLLKEDMSTTLAYGLGGLMTIFSIQKHATNWKPSWPGNATRRRKNPSASGTSSCPASWSWTGRSLRNSSATCWQSSATGPRPPNTRATRAWM